MELHSYHFYNPFKSPALWFYLNDPNNKYSNDSMSYVMDDVDLYYQPLEPQWIAIFFFFVRLTIIVFGQFIGTKVVILMKRENGILSEVTILFMITQMVFHPILIFFELTVNLIHPVDEVMGPWVCYVAWLFYSFSTSIVLNYSFIAAIMRYTFVVHEERVGQYGKEKVKRYFLYLSVAVVIIVIIMRIIDGTSSLSFINKCYGRDHEVFLIETSSLAVLKRKFWESAERQHQNLVDKLLDIAKRALKVLDSIQFLVLGFNITEAIIYKMIFSHLDR